MKNILIFVSFLLICLKRTIISISVRYSFNLWINSIFPSIFPLMILSDLILSTDFIRYIANSIGRIFSKLFKVNKYASYVFLMSMITGCPSNAKYIKDLYDNKVIYAEEIVKILSMSLLYNPLLIISITPYLRINEQLFLIGINILINLIIGFINRNFNVSYSNNDLKMRKFNLVNSISNGINSLMLILGVIITFNIINSLLFFKHPLITGILEITNGIILINNSYLLYKYKFIFTGILLSLGGFSILMQIKSIFKDTLIDYSLFYKSRIIHLLLMIIMCYIYYFISKPILDPLV